MSETLGSLCDKLTIVKLKQIIPAKVVVAGNPAQIVREVSAKDEAFWNRGKQLYIDLAKKYLYEGMEPVSEVKME